MRSCFAILQNFVNNHLIITALRVRDAKLIKSQFVRCGALKMKSLRWFAILLFTGGYLLPSASACTYVALYKIAVPLYLT